MADSMSLPALLRDSTIKNRFIETLGQNANRFIATLMQIYNSNSKIKECEPKSIVGAAGLAAILHLSITPSLGHAYIVPYKDGNESKAQFMIGVRGLVQLAHRTGQYVALNADKVYEGQIRDFNPITGVPTFGKIISNKVVGYAAYMKLVTGFEKTIYMTKEQVEEHARTYSKSYASDKRTGKKTSPWSTNFDAMATKTVLKKLLRSWGILSDELNSAIQGDQAVVDDTTYTYVDNGGNIKQRDDIFIPDTPPAIDDAQTIDISDQADAAEVVADVNRVERKDPF